MSGLERTYQFEIGEYAEKVEIHGDKRAPDSRAAYMEIREDRVLELVEELLSEVETHE